MADRGGRTIVPDTDLKREYAEAWPVLAYVLKEASTEDTFVQAREAFVQACTPTQLLIVVKPGGPRSVGASLNKAARGLTPLDAFACWNDTPGILRRLDSLHEHVALKPKCIRVMDEMRAWERCKDDAQYGEQAMITILLMRDDPEKTTRIQQHLSSLSSQRTKKKDSIHACALQVGALLYNRV